ncbi:MAG: hypothetical protein JXQ29_17710 [Planctomycetes bacterium]|nr:hypothetical protein [Planctomycetota bacterium]
MKYVEKMKHNRLGELLIEEGLVTTDQLVEALQEQKKTGAPIGQLLVSFGFLSERDVARTLAKRFQLPFIQVTRYAISKDLLELFPRDFLHRHQCAPLDRFDRILTVAVAHPIAKEVLEELQERSGCEVHLYVALASELRQTLAQHFSVDGAAAPQDPPLVVRRKKAAGEKTAAELSDPINDEWEKLFDLANESVLSEIKLEPQRNDD